MSLSVLTSVGRFFKPYLVIHWFTFILMYLYLLMEMVFDTTPGS